MAGFILALQFFTRLPINKNIDFTKKNLRACFFFLPFIGLLFGAVTASIMYVCHEPTLSSLLAVAAYIVLGGSLHLDGLADCADGFAAHTETEKTLAIMSDPHAGTFAAIAIMLDVLFRFVLYQLLQLQPLLLIVPPVLARITVLFVIAHGTPAKKTGLGSAFHTAISRLCFPLYFILIVLCFVAAIYFSILPIHFIAIPFINWAIAALIMYYAQKRIGGTTGDINGATVEILELNTLLFCTIFF